MQQTLSNGAPNSETASAYTPPKSIAGAERKMESVGKKIESRQERLDRLKNSIQNDIEKMRQRAQEIKDELSNIASRKQQMKDNLEAKKAEVDGRVQSSKLGDKLRKAQNDKQALEKLFKTSATSTSQQHGND